MAVVNLSFAGRIYDIACDDSQAARVQEMGGEIDRRAQMLVSQVGHVSDARLLVMVSLMLADELADQREQVRQLTGDLNAAVHGETRVADTLDALALRIEGIAERLERS